MYLLHKEWDAVYGTVLMFHGFSATRLADESSCTVSIRKWLQYLPAWTLSTRFFVNPDKNWPKHNLKKNIKEKLVKKLKSDQELAAYIQNFISISILKALNENALLAAVSDEEFGHASPKYYESHHVKYLHEVEQQMKEVAALPGPLFTVGLSMGGATAFSLAATHSEKLQGLLYLHPSSRKLLLSEKLIGPLVQTINPYRVLFSKLTAGHALSFLNCLVDGIFARTFKCLTLIVQTEIDDCRGPVVGLRITKEIEARLKPDWDS